MREILFKDEERRRYENIAEEDERSGLKGSIIGASALKHSYCPGGDILTGLHAPADLLQPEEFELQLGPKQIIIPLRVLNGNDPVCIVLTANLPDATLGPADFDLKFQKKADFEQARPPCRDKGQTMSLQNRDKVFTMVPPMATAGDQKLKGKATPKLPRIKDSMTSATTTHRETP